MLCSNCGRELDPLAGGCPCRETQQDVKVLTPEERESFQGITISDGPAKEDNNQYQSQASGQKVYFRQVTFGSGGISLWAKLAIAAAFAALIFIFLPLALLFIASVSLVWLVMRFIRR